MIKFFRKIRQSLLTEGKTKQYLKYAIGEIILVMIGILLALQVNNWNEERINRAKSDELLAGIVSDLGQDIAGLDRSIEFHQSRQAFLARHMLKTDFSTTATDTLFHIFDATASPFSITDLSYEKAKNLGISQLTSNDSLSLSINKYYTRTFFIFSLLREFQFDEYVRLNNFWMKDQEDLEFSFDTSLDIPIMQDSIARRSKAIAGITSPRGRNHISQECVLLKNSLRFLKETREIAEGLHSDIETYLAR